MPCSFQVQKNLKTDMCHRKCFVKYQASQQFVGGTKFKFQQTKPSERATCIGVYQTGNINCTKQLA